MSDTRDTWSSKSVVPFGLFGRFAKSLYSQKKTPLTHSTIFEGLSVCLSFCRVQDQFHAIYKKSHDLVNETESFCSLISRSNNLLESIVIYISITASSRPPEYKSIN